MVTRARSDSIVDERGARKQRVSDPGLYFAAALFSEGNIKVLAEQYKPARPVIDKIFTESLLTRVKVEMLEHLSFPEKRPTCTRSIARVSAA